MKNKKTHIKKEERFLIEKMLKINKSITEIARLLERGVSSISEEVSRNGGIGRYSSTTADLKARERQQTKKASLNKVSRNKKLQVLIKKYRLEGLSPEKISVKLKLKKQVLLDVSPKSIRKYLKQIGAI
jgi:IS30 family transposase